MNKISLGLEILKIKITKKYKPLIVSWPITYRCNKRCRYCSVPKKKYKELDTKQCLNMIDTLKKKGTRILTITGGEPTLREDLGDVLRYAKKKGISVLLNTNGTNLNKELVSLVDAASLSLDGPETINDDIRGKGSYKEVIEGVRTCKQNNVPVSLTCVVSSKNIKHIKDTLRIGKRYKTGIVFQPMHRKQVGIPTARNLLPEEDSVKDIINYLVEQKKKGAYVRNSVAALKHFLSYPKGKCIGCISGKIYLRLTPDGYVDYCGSFTLEKEVKVGSISNKELKRLVNRPDCRQCLCSNLVELNHIYNLNLDASFNILNY